MEQVSFLSSDVWIENANKFMDVLTVLSTIGYPEDKGDSIICVSTILTLAMIVFLCLSLWFMKSIGAYVFIVCFFAVAGIMVR